MENTTKHINKQDVPTPIELRVRIMEMEQQYRIKITNKFIAGRLNTSETTITKGFKGERLFIRARIKELLDTIASEQKLEQNAA